MMKANNTRLLFSVVLASLAVREILQFSTDSQSLKQPAFDGTVARSADVAMCTDLTASDSIPLLVRALRDDPESSLFPLTLTSNKTNARYHYPGLDEDLLATAFRGRKIALLGDSTLFYVTKWLYALLMYKQQVPGDEDGQWVEQGNQTTTAPMLYRNLSKLPLSQANQFVRNVSSHCHAEQCIQLHGWRAETPGFSALPLPIADEDDGTYIWWSGVSGENKQFEKAFSKAWALAHQQKPEIVIVNMGLHFLHFYGHGRNMAGPFMNAWIHYEEWLAHALEQSISAGAGVVLFKTSNFVCDDKYTGKWAKAVPLYREMDTATLDQCQVAATQQSKRDGYNFTDEEIRNYCQLGVLDEDGSSYLNERMVKFVKTAAEKYFQVKIAIFNDHAVEQCQHTQVDDGRHYHESVLLRIRMLANQIDCLAPRNSSVIEAAM